MMLRKLALSTILGGLFLTGLLLNPKLAFAAEGEDDGASATLSASASESEPKKPWAVILNAEHYIGHRGDVDDFTQFYLDGRYKLNDTHAFRIVQPARKLYEVPSIGGSEFQVDDLYLFHYFTVAKDFLTTTVKLRSSLTVPWSSVSRKETVITRPEVRVEISRKFFDDSLTLAYRPSFAFYINEYSSTQGSGRPVKKYVLSHSLLAQYTPKFWKPLEKLTAYGIFAGGYNWLHKVAAGARNPANGTYSWEMGLEYAFNKHIATRVGFYQGDSFIKNGISQIYFIDEKNTQAYVALDLSI